METPPKIEIVGFEPSAHVRELIEANISKLEKHCPRITSCRIAIKAPGAHHRKGEPYGVTIQLALPGGKEVHVAQDKNANDPRHADIAFAISDAFHRASRQLREDVRKLEGFTRRSSEAD